MLELALGDRESGVHPLLVVRLFLGLVVDVAHQDVAAGVEVHRDGLRVADGDVLDLIDRFDPLPRLVDGPVRLGGECLRSEVRLDDGELVDVVRSVFVTVKVTSPAGAEVVSGITANSCTLTFRVPGTEVFDVVGSPAEVPSDEHPDSTTGPATTELLTTSPSLMMAPFRRSSDQHDSTLLRFAHAQSSESNWPTDTDSHRGFTSKFRPGTAANVQTSRAVREQSPPTSMRTAHARSPESYPSSS